MDMFNKLFKGVAESPRAPDVGRELVVGDYKVTVMDLIAQGGFASVYLVKDPSGNQYALKKMRTHDAESTASAQREIDAMNELKDVPNVVQLYASSKLPNGRFTEFLMLMEFCPGGHVVDIMNRRLTRPFDEKEVLKIFSDVCLGVAAMHHRAPAIIHRDLKPENVLLAANHGCFKICDFGSVTREPVTPGERVPIAISEEEIQKYTTLQYRAPEMIDLYQQKVINEKADIWALGCILFKLCFFEDAFGESTLPILSGKYKIPEAKAARFSKDLLALIRGMLEPDPDVRLSVDDVLQQAFALRGLPCPIKRRKSSATPKRLPKTPRAAASSSSSETPAAAKVVADPFASTQSGASGSSSSGSSWGFFVEPTAEESSGQPPQAARSMSGAAAAAADPFGAPPSQAKGHQRFSSVDLAAQSPFGDPFAPAPASSTSARRTHHRVMSADFGSLSSPPTMQPATSNPFLSDADQQPLQQPPPPPPPVSRSTSQPPPPPSASALLSAPAPDAGAAAPRPPERASSQPPPPPSWKRQPPPAAGGESAPASSPSGTRRTLPPAPPPSSSSSQQQSDLTNNPFLAPVASSGRAPRH